MNKKFVDNLTNFSTALEGIVDALNEQVNRDKNQDAILDVLNEIDANKIKVISKNLSEINARTVRIENRTDEIAEIVKSSKENEGLDPMKKISNGDNKKSLKDGVTAIILIAGAILLLGVAFKIIGNVDIGSVIAISIAIAILTRSFKDISEIEGLDSKKVLAISSMILLMAVSVVIASYLISSMSPISIAQLTTFALLTLTFSYSLVGIANGMRKMNFSGNLLKNILLLPIILPAMALGIALSSLVLSWMKPISWKISLSIMLFSIALVPMAFAFSMVGKAVKGMSLKDMIFSSLAIPLMSIGLALSSWIIRKYFEPLTLGEGIALVLTSLAIGLSMLAFLPAMYLLSKAKLSIKGLLLATLGIVFISTAIAISAGIFYLANTLQPGLFDSPVPDFMWSLQTGLSIIAFLPSFLILAKLLNPGNLVGMALALLAIPMIALAIVATAFIFEKLGNFGAHPSVGWSIGSGLAIAGFAVGMLALGFLVTATGGLALVALAASLLAIPLIIGGMIVAAELLNTYNWAETKYPSVEWANGVGTAIFMFAKAYGAITLLEGLSSILSFFGGSGKSMEEFILGKKVGEGRDGSGVIDILITAGKLFNSPKAKGAFGGNYPSPEWANGVGGAIASFARAYADMTSAEEDSDVSFKDFLLGTDGETNGGIIGIMVEIGKRFNAAGGIFNSSKDITDPNYGQIVSNFVNQLPSGDKIEDFESFLEVFEGISKIVRNIDRLSDSLNRLAKSLNNVKNTDLKTINDKNSNIFGDFNSNTNLTQNVNNINHNKQGRNDTEINKIKDPFSVDPMKELIEYTKNIDSNLKTIVDNGTGSNLNNNEDTIGFSIPNNVNDE